MGRKGETHTLYERRKLPKPMNQYFRLYGLGEMNRRSKKGLDGTNPKRVIVGLRVPQYVVDKVEKFSTSDNLENPRVYRSSFYTTAVQLFVALLGEGEDLFAICQSLEKIVISPYWHSNIVRFAKITGVTIEDLNQTVISTSMDESDTDEGEITDPGEGINHYMKPVVIRIKDKIVNTNYIVSISVDDGSISGIPSVTIKMIDGEELTTTEERVIAAILNAFA